MTTLVDRVVHLSGRPEEGKGGQRSGRSERAGRHASAPRVPFALLVTGLIVGGLALLLLLNTVSAANEVRRHDLAGGDARIAARVQELENEVAESAAPANLAAAAAALGMVPAGNPAFLVIDANGSVHVLGSPAPASMAVVAQETHKKKKVTKSAKTSAAKTTAAKTTGADSTAAKSTAAKTTAAKTSAGHTPAPPTHATPTPTPTLTLPGGNR
jgi:hypothetical protein